jgi:hypothetical protein
MLNSALSIFTSTQDLILIYDKTNFMGKIYMLPCYKSISWKLDNMTNAQKYHDQTDALLGIMNKKYGLEKREGDGKKEKEDENNNIFLPSNLMSIGNFIEEFKFYFNRSFSCIIPENTTMIIHPFDRNNPDDEPLILKSGKHDKVFYSIPSVREFHIEKNIYS